MGFLCGDCDGGGDAAVWGRVRRRMREDYPGINEGTLVAEAGRA